jgi:hypothetical protein
VSSSISADMIKLPCASSRAPEKTCSWAAPFPVLVNKVDATELNGEVLLGAGVQVRISSSASVLEPNYSLACLLGETLSVFHSPQL